MGFKKPTRKSLSPQESIASQGGLIPRAFLAACVQFPPPPPELEPPSFGTLEQFGMLCLALILIFALVLLALPEKWGQKIIQVAFCIGRRKQ